MREKHSWLAGPHVFDAGLAGLVASRVFRLNAEFSFDQDQFVAAGQPQAIKLPAMPNGDFAFARKKVGTFHHRRIRSGKSDTHCPVPSGFCFH